MTAIQDFLVVVLLAWGQVTVPVEGCAPQIKMPEWKTWEDLPSPRLTLKVTPPDYIEERIGDFMVVLRPFEPGFEQELKVVIECAADYPVEIKCTIFPPWDHFVVLPPPDNLTDFYQTRGFSFQNTTDAEIAACDCQKKGEPRLRQFANLVKGVTQMRISLSAEGRARRPKIVKSNEEVKFEPYEIPRTFPPFLMTYRLPRNKVNQSIYCGASGQPAPVDFTMSRLNNDSAETRMAIRRISPTPHFAYCVLTFPNATDSVEGTYRCSTSNSAGKTSALIQVLLFDSHV